MGAGLSRIFSIIDARIVMVGLDAAGKSTILYRLKLARTVSTVPTIGFNVESLQYKNLDLTVWDLGGQEKLRMLWRHYLVGVDAVIFVVDSSDVGRIDAARSELHALCQDPLLKDAKVLIFANKQDIPNRMSPEAMIRSLQLDSIRQKYLLVPTNAVSGEGVCTGMDWLAKSLVSSRKTIKMPTRHKENYHWPALFTSSQRATTRTT